MKLLDRIKRISNNKFFLAIILVIYIAMMVYAEFYHEFWRDELQAWVIARDLSFVDIFKQMRWEGHPCLWHLILFPFAKLGFSPIAMGFISIFFMFLTGIIIMYKSPFNFVVKILLLFSSPFLYFYSIVSRVYSIIPFLICLLAIVYPKRLDRPLLYAVILALITNTHIMMSCFVGILTLFYLKDIIKSNGYKDLRYFCSLGIILIGIIVLFLQVRESLSINSIVINIDSYDFNYSTNPFLNIIFKLINGIGYEMNSYIGLVYMKPIYLIITFIVFIIGILIGLVKSFKTTMVGIIPFVFVFLIHVFIWFSISQRSVMIIIFLMFAVWIHYYDNKSKKSFIVWEVILSLFCLLSIPYGFSNYFYDINNPVSGAKETAEYITNNLDDALFICPVDYVATSIAGYIDEDIFYSNIRKEYFTFATWDSYWRKEVSFDEFYGNIKSFMLINNHKDIYLIYSSEFVFSYDIYIEYLLENNIIKQIYYSPEGKEHEQYIIYKFLK